MQNIINFENLPTDTQRDVIRTLYFYNRCHIEHSHGKISVQTSYCLMNEYSKDQWVSQDFTRKELDIRFNGQDAYFKAWNNLEKEQRKHWVDIDEEAKKNCRDNFNKMIETKVDKDLRRLTEEAR